MKTHYTTPGRAVAICGANQGQKLARRIGLTTDTNRVTCAKCAKRMHELLAFYRSLNGGK